MLQFAPQLTLTKGIKMIFWINISSYQFGHISVNETRKFGRKSVRTVILNFNSENIY